MKQYRITKYNPSYRNNKGHYTINEWTDFSNIGEKFNGIELTLDDYLKIEDAYIKTAISVLQKCNIENLTIKNLELPRKKQNLYQNKTISTRDIAIILRDILRNKIWCKLEAESAFIHIGFDYYMYIGCNLPKQEVKEIVKKNSLYCEEMQSPYWGEQE